MISMAEVLLTPATCLDEIILILEIMPNQRSNQES